MKWTRKQLGWGDTEFVGRKRGFVFTYSYNEHYKYWLVSVTHKKKDIDYYSLNDDLVFLTEKETQEWCERFDFKKHKCTGADAHKLIGEKK